MPELFAKSNLMGTFKGFTERGFEFSAEIVTPYNASMLEKPQLGQFILIELGDPQEASLGRITKFVPSGMLATAEGEDYINTMQRRDQKIPEDVKKDKLKYKVEIKLLGAVKVVKDPQNGLGEEIVFVPSQRRLPHLGANVALPSNEVLKEICSLSQGNTDLGDYALGEFIYSGNNGYSGSNGISGNHNIQDRGFRYIDPKLEVKFNINNLVSKRSVVFARAGYGKSNLIKYLISELYKHNGTYARTEKGDKVGTLIFDADGEYFWPDHKNRPGLCDVPDLRSQIVVFTNRKAKNQYYESFKAGTVKIDIRNLPARDVIGIAISSDRQLQQNVIKLRSLRHENWTKLVDLIYKHGLQADDKEVSNLIGCSDPKSAQVEVSAAKSNMFNVVTHLHDPQSGLIKGAKEALENGMIVIVDISLLSSSAGNNVAGLLMRRIFNHNQKNFTGGSSPIPVIAIIEEAQSILGHHLEESSPFVEWVKEGRKYDLGAIMVTQQPGSLAPEIISQADNWFAFHLLSEADAATLGRYNSHFSHDILAHIIGEPIQGNCYMWSAPKQPFVLPVRIRNFEKLYNSFIVKEPEAEAYMGSPAAEIRKENEEKFRLFAESVHEEMKKSSFKPYNFHDGYMSIYSGRLYHLFKRILSKPEFMNEVIEPDQLYMPVLRLIFETDIKIIKHPYQSKPDCDYYCIPSDIWMKKFKSSDELSLF